MSLRSLIVVIPHFPLKPAYGHTTRLQRTVERVLKEGVGDIRIVTSEQTFFPDPRVTVHRIETAREDDTDFPRGWMAAAKITAASTPGHPLLIIHDEIGDTHPWCIGKALHTMAEEKPQVLISVVPSVDHPCQIESYFDVFCSVAFLKVDEAAPDLRAALEVGLEEIPQHWISRPITLPPFCHPPVNPSVASLFEYQHWSRWVPLSLTRHASPASLYSKVFFWFEGPGVVRQIQFSPMVPAALPLALPVAYAPVFLARRDGGYRAFISARVTGAMEICFFPMTRTANPLLRIAIEERGKKQGALDLSGEAFRHAFDRSGEVIDDVFLCNLLRDSTLPETDIPLPFLPRHATWETDPVSSHKRNALTGQVIHGRQEFPPVYENTRAFLGLSEAFASDPECALSNGDIRYLTLSDFEKLPDQGSAH